MKLAYYPGCSGQGTSAEYERSTRAVCRALEIGLKEISDWSCCGSTPAHACDHVLSSALSARNLVLAAAEGAERVGTPCPSSTPSISDWRSMAIEMARRTRTSLKKGCSRLNPRKV